MPKILYRGECKEATQTEKIKKTKKQKKRSIQEGVLEGH